MLKREFYLEKIRPAIGKPVIKVLTGMRRVGKSTLLQQIQAELIESGIQKERIICINFEWLQNESLLDFRKLHEYISSLTVGLGKYYVFFDEIQEVPSFERVINSLYSQGQVELFITGSNSKLLSGELATLLTGRYLTFEIFPFSFQEVCQYKPDQSREELFIEYLKFGGIPARFEMSDPQNAGNYLLDIYQSILLRDLVDRYSIRDVELLTRFMKYMMQNTAQPFSATTVSRFLKSENRNLSRETIYHYLDAALSAFLMHRVPRLDLRGKEILRTQEKFFVNDLGLRALFFSNEQAIGQSFETLVFLELSRRGYQVFVGRLGDREVDFVIERSGQRCYIQVAYLLADPATWERELSVLEAIPDNFPKYVISMDPFDRSARGIRHRNLMKFLLDPEELLDI